ncbi:MAG: hypothetical protein J1F35_08460 [Erysipelotrichales bacterium]|nr:hypothetical protein [Erysipelotrichales bacterium]
MNIIETMYNKYARIYKKNVDSLEFIKTPPKYADTNSKNLVEIKPDHSEEIKALRNLCIDVYDENKKVYRKSNFARKIKMLLFYDAPLAALITASYFVFQTPKNSEVVPVYNIKQTSISDDKMISDIDETNYYIPKYEDALSDEEFVKVSDTNTQIQYQIKNGTNNIIVSLKVDDSGIINAYNYLSGTFFDNNVALFKGIEPSEIEEKYQEMVDDISEFIINDSNLSSDQKNAIQEMLEDSKSMVITTFVEFIESGEVESIESDNELNKNIALREAMSLIIYIVLMAILYGVKGIKIERIRISEGINLELEGSYDLLIPFKSAIDTRELFLQVEKRRRENIEDFAHRNLEGETKKLFLKQ